MICEPCPTLLPCWHPCPLEPAWHNESYRVHIVLERVSLIERVIIRELELGEVQKMKVMHEELTGESGYQVEHWVSLVASCVIRLLLKS